MADSNFDPTTHNTPQSPVPDESTSQTSQGHEPDQRLENLLAIDDFIFRTSHIDDDDYGDWMRRANLYWWDLLGVLKDVPESLNFLMQQMHEHFQFNPDFNLIDTRIGVLETALEMREILGTRIPLDAHSFDLSYTDHQP
jgi:hypothetical protein